MQRHIQASLLAATVAGLAVSYAQASASDFEIVARHTDAAPGIAGANFAGISWSGPFQAPTIDSSGKVGFKAILEDSTSLGIDFSNNEVFYYGGPGTLQQVARSGNAGPGNPGAPDTVNFFQNYILPLSPNGNAHFGAHTPDPNGYIATGPALSMQKVVRMGETLPGIGAATISLNPASSSNYYNVNNNGQTLIFSSLSDDGFAHWVGNAAEKKLIFRNGTVGNGLNAPVVGQANSSIMNGSGNVLGGVRLGTGLDTDNDALFIKNYSSPTFTILAREGGVAPGTGGANYPEMPMFSPFFPESSPFNFTDGHFNNSNRAVFSSALAGSGVVDFVNDAAIFYHDGSTKLFRRRGSTTTAVAGAKLEFDPFVTYNLRLNNSNTVAWTSLLLNGTGGVDSTNDSVVLTSTLGSASDTLIAREGAAAPGVPGALLGTDFYNLQQNNVGQLFFSTLLQDDPSNPNDNVAFENDLALFAWDPATGLRMILREGDELTGMGLPGKYFMDFQTAGSANAEGGSLFLSDNGWLAMRIVAGDSYGAANADTMAVVRTVIPEPASMGLMAFAVLFGRRRRA